MARPGFVDLQVNGFAGTDFSDPATTIDEILKASDDLTHQGTAGFLATVATSAREVMEESIHTIAQAMKKQDGGGPLLGIHMEGPFISPEYGCRGMHAAENISPPDLQWFERVQKIAEGTIRLMTLAPEYEGAIEFIRAVSSGVVVSAGHTACSFAQARHAVDAGLQLATHIGNGCRQTIDRHDNPIVNLLACPELTLSFIPDGFHLPEAFIRMLVNSRPIDKLIVVSDSMGFAGMAPGKYTTSSGVEVVLGQEGRLSLATDPNVTAGSSATMLKCMNHLSSLGLLRR